MSHQVDLTAHGVASRWDGYRAYTERQWRLLLGRRDFLINRAPVSEHLALLDRHGFTDRSVMKYYRGDGVRRDELQPAWQALSEDDLTCSGFYFATF